MVLHALHTTAEGGTEDAAIEEFEEIRRQIHFEERQHLTFWGMFKQPTLRKRLILGFFLQCLTQSSGVLVVFNYQVRTRSSQDIVSKAEPHIFNERYIDRSFYIRTWALLALSLYFF